MVAAQDRCLGEESTATLDLPQASSGLGEHQNLLATVILPAYNEELALPAVLETMFEVLNERYEVIVVDDGSTDGTSEQAARFPCRAFRHERNRGKGAAVRTALLEAKAPFVIIMDADNTYPASAIPEMVALAERCDFVRCARVEGLAHHPGVNRLGNWIFDRILQVLHGLVGPDHLTGLYGMRREAWEAVDVHADRFDLEVEVAIKARALGLRSSVLPITYGERLGKKKLRPVRDGLRILSRIMVLRFRGTPGGPVRAGSVRAAGAASE